MKFVLLLLVTVFIVPVCNGAEQLKLSPYEFEADNGEKVKAELGELKVPEKRSSDKKREITLRFVKFSSSTSREKGSPIIYLAGGPGGSGISAARGSRFPLFMAMREFGDVIAFDQRGIGMSEPDLSCKESYMVPFNKPVSRAEAGKIFADAAKQCFDRLGKEGIDLSAYNTRESAADLNDLRVALGASKMTLWGISYGTHLALAAMKYHGAAIDRVILAGVEPLDHTLKLPVDQEKLMLKIGELAKRNAAVKAAVPDLHSSIKGLMQKLEKEPQTVSLTHPLNGQKADVTVGKFDLQYVLASMLVGPETFAVMPDFVARLEKGDWTALALLSAQQRIGTVFNAMGIAMDCASGADRPWLDEIERQAASTLLGSAINFPFFEICGSQSFDLGAEFRKPIRSTIPALMISGTLDGRTPPGNAERISRDLVQSQHLVIEGAGHSDPLFLSSPKIFDAIKNFMNGKKIPEPKITIQEPRFIEPRSVVAVSEEVLNRYVGSYRINEKEVRRVIKAGDLLYTQRGERDPLPIRPMSEREFFYENTATRVRFDVDANNQITGMTMFEAGNNKGDFAAKIKEP